MNENIENQEGDFLNLNPPRLFIFNQNQNNVNDVRVILEENNVILHYPSDDIIEFREVDKNIINKIKSNKQLEVFEIIEHSGHIKNVYLARI